MNIPYHTAYRKTLCLFKKYIGTALELTKVRVIQSLIGVLNLQQLQQTSRRTTPLFYFLCFFNN